MRDSPRRVGGHLVRPVLYLPPQGVGEGGGVEAARHDLKVNPTRRFSEAAGNLKQRQSHGVENECNP